MTKRTWDFAIAVGAIAATAVVALDAPHPSTSAITMLVGGMITLQSLLPSKENAQ